MREGRERELGPNTAASSWSRREELDSERGGGWLQASLDCLFLDSRRMVRVFAIL